MANSPRLASAFGPVPFDKHTTPYAVELVDTFITAIANADLDGASAVTSDLRWIGDEGGGDSAPAVAIVASRVNHQGIIALSTGGTTAADGDIAGLTLPNAVLADGNGLYFGALIEIPDVSDTKVSVGFTATRTEAVNSSAANVAAIVFDPEDAANVGDKWFFLQLNVGSTDLEAVFDGVSYVEGDWVYLELVLDDTGVTGRVTTEDASQTLHLAGAMTTALLPGFLVEAVGAAEELINIDTAIFRSWYAVPSSILGA